LHGKIRSVNSISEFWIPGIGGVKEATHEKNVETMKCEMPEYVHPTPFRSFEYWEIEKSRVEILQHRSPEVVKSGILKSRKRHINKSFIDREINLFRSPGYREFKCRNTSPQESWYHEM
jgi:hypothetical protein